MARKKREGAKKGCAKSGRNKAWCKTYAMLGRRKTNKRKKLQRHLRNFPNDLQAKNALQNL